MKKLDIEFGSEDTIKRFPMPPDSTSYGPSRPELEKLDYSIIKSNFGTPDAVCAEVPMAPVREMKLEPNWLYLHLPSNNNFLSLIYVASTGANPKGCCFNRNLISFWGSFWVVEGGERQSNWEYLVSGFALKKTKYLRFCSSVVDKGPQSEILPIFWGREWLDLGLELSRELGLSTRNLDRVLHKRYEF